MNKYCRIRVPGSRRLVMEHVVVWERANGAVPAHHELHHINGDKADNRLENLQLVSRFQHKLIHSGCALQGGVWMKPCRKCGVLKPRVDYYRKPDGIMSICRSCAIALATEVKRKRRLARQRLAEGSPAQSGATEGGSHPAS